MNKIVHLTIDKGIPGDEDPSDGTDFVYRAYISNEPNIDNLLDILQNGQQVEVFDAKGRLTPQRVFKADEPARLSFKTDKTGTAFVNTTCESPTAGLTANTMDEISIVEEGVTSISFSPDPIEGTEGDTIQLSITVNTTDPGIDDSYSLSYDSAVISVDSNNLATLVAEGTATLTVTSQYDPSVKKEVSVTVHPQPEVTGITVNPASVTGLEGSTQQLDISVQTIGTASADYTTSSDNEAVATIDANDVVSLVSDGSAIITITSVFDNSFTETVAVTVDPVSATAFVMLVDTEQAGVSNNDQFQLTGAEGTYTAKWETNEQELTGEQTLTFSAPGQYVVEITGIERIQFNNGGDKDKLLRVQQWGNTTWTSMANAFNGCDNLDVTATDVPDFSGLSSVLQMFRACSSLVGNSSFENWNMTGVSNRNGMFLQCSLFNQDVSQHDYSDMTNGLNLFANSGINQSFEDIQLNSGLTTLQAMFFNSAMSRENYSRSVTGMGNYVHANSGPNGVNFTAQNGMEYDDEAFSITGEFNNAVDARAYLVDTATWDIDGDTDATFEPDPEVFSIEVYDQDPDGAHNPEPVARDGNDGTLDLSSEETVRLYAKVGADDGLITTATFTSSNTNKMSVSVVDGNTADIDRVASEPGDKVNLTVTSDEDPSFSATIEISLFEDTPVSDTESATFVFET